MCSIFWFPWRKTVRSRCWFVHAFNLLLRGILPRYHSRKHLSGHHFVWLKPVWNRCKKLRRILSCQSRKFGKMLAKRRIPAVSIRMTERIDDIELYCYRFILPEPEGRVWIFVRGFLHRDWRERIKGRFCERSVLYETFETKMDKPLSGCPS